MQHRMEEKLGKVLDYSMTAAQNKNATETYDADAQTLDLRWRFMSQVHDALESVEKRKAIIRLFNSQMVSVGGSSYVSDVFQVFFDDLLTGLMYLGTAKK